MITRECQYLVDLYECFHEGEINLQKERTNFDDYHNNNTKNNNNDDDDNSHQTKDEIQYKKQIVRVKSKSVDIDANYFTQETLKKLKLQKEELQHKELDYNLESDDPFIPIKIDENEIKIMDNGRKVVKQMQKIKSLLKKKQSLRYMIHLVKLYQEEASQIEEFQESQRNKLLSKARKHEPTNSETSKQKIKESNDKYGFGLSINDSISSQGNSSMTMDSATDGVLPVSREETLIYPKMPDFSEKRTDATNSKKSITSRITKLFSKFHDKKSRFANMFFKNNEGIDIQNEGQILDNLSVDFKTREPPSFQKQKISDNHTGLNNLSNIETHNANIRISQKDNIDISDTSVMNTQDMCKKIESCFLKSIYQDETSYLSGLIFLLRTRPRYLTNLFLELESFRFPEKWASFIQDGKTKEKLLEEKNDLRIALMCQFARVIVQCLFQLDKYYSDERKTEYVLQYEKNQFLFLQLVDCLLEMDFQLLHIPNYENRKQNSPLYSSKIEQNRFTFNENQRIVSPFEEDSKDSNLCSFSFVLNEYSKADIVQSFIEENLWKECLEPVLFEPYKEEIHGFLNHSNNDFKEKAIQRKESDSDTNEDHFYPNMEIKLRYKEIRDILSKKTTAPAMSNSFHHSHVSSSSSTLGARMCSIHTKKDSECIRLLKKHLNHFEYMMNMILERMQNVLVMKTPFVLKYVFQKYYKRLKLEYSSSSNHSYNISLVGSLMYHFCISEPLKYWMTTHLQKFKSRASYLFKINYILEDFDKIFNALLNHTKFNNFFEPHLISFNPWLEKNYAFMNKIIEETINAEGSTFDAKLHFDYDFLENEVFISKKDILTMKQADVSFLLKVVHSFYPSMVPKNEAIRIEDRLFKLHHKFCIQLKYCDTNQIEELLFTRLKEGEIKVLPENFFLAEDIDEYNENMKKQLRYYRVKVAIRDILSMIKPSVFYSIFKELNPKYEKNIHSAPPVGLFRDRANSYSAGQQIVSNHERLHLLLAYNNSYNTSNSLSSSFVKQISDKSVRNDFNANRMHRLIDCEFQTLDSFCNELKDVIHGKPRSYLSTEMQEYHVFICERINRICKTMKSFENGFITSESILRDLFNDVVAYLQNKKEMIRKGVPMKHKKNELFPIVSDIQLLPARVYKKPVPLLLLRQTKFLETLQQEVEELQNTFNETLIDHFVIELSQKYQQREISELSYTIEELIRMGCINSNCLINYCYNPRKRVKIVLDSKKYKTLTIYEETDSQNSHKRNYLKEIQIESVFSKHISNCNTIFEGKLNDENVSTYRMDSSFQQNSSWETISNIDFDMAMMDTKGKLVGSPSLCEKFLNFRKSEKKDINLYQGDVKIIEGGLNTFTPSSSDSPVTPLEEIENQRKKETTFGRMNPFKSKSKDGNDTFSIPNRVMNARTGEIPFEKIIFDEPRLMFLVLNHCYTLKEPSEMEKKGKGLNLKSKFSSKCRSLSGTFLLSRSTSTPGGKRDQPKSKGKFVDLSNIPDDPLPNNVPSEIRPIIVRDVTEQKRDSFNESPA